MIIQHEIDHLNGILFIDRIKDCDNTAKNTTLVGFVYNFSVKKVSGICNNFSVKKRKNIDTVWDG